MVKLAQRMTRISESATLAMNTLAKQLKQEGKDVISMTVGEPDFPTPAFIKEAAKQAMDASDVDHYTVTTGIAPLRQAICDYHKRHDQLDYTPDQVVVMNGAKSVLFGLFQALLDEGDEVLVPSPCWVSYVDQVSLAGGTIKRIETDLASHFKVTLDQLEAAYSEKSKVLLLNAPSNPTGAFYCAEELLAIGEWAVSKNLVIIADEIYYQLVYNGAVAPSIAAMSEEIKNHTVVVNGVSKTYAMTGWRIGYLLSTNQDLLKAMNKFNSHSAGNPSAISQYAALAAYSEAGDAAAEEMRQIFEKRLNHIYPLIAEIPGFKADKPEGTFYIFVHAKEAADLVGLPSVDAFAQALLREKLVAVVPGTAFNAPDYFRLSFTASEDELTQGVARIKAFVEENRMR